MYSNTPNSQQYNSLKYNKTENPRVGGSIPPLGTILMLGFVSFYQVRFSRCATIF